MVGIATQKINGKHERNMHAVVVTFVIDSLRSIPMFLAGNLQTLNIYILWITDFFVTEKHPVRSLPHSKRLLTEHL